MDCRNSFVPVIVRREGDKHNTHRAEESSELPYFADTCLKQHGHQQGRGKEREHSPPVYKIVIPAERAIGRVTRAQAEAAHAPNYETKEKSG